MIFMLHKQQGCIPMESPHPGDETGTVVFTGHNNYVDSDEGHLHRRS